MLAPTLLTLAGLVGLSTAGGYVLEDDYDPSSFFSMFNFFTGPDPTHGFVDYLDQSSAQSAGLINIENNAVYMGVDYNNIASASGRPSVRVTSAKSYNHGLIVADIAHMPGSICGTWPAFWTVGPNWPNNGEIDIIEGVNDQSHNDVTLHTSAGCSISNNGGFSGAITTPNCDVNAAGQPTNAGCSITSLDSTSYGTGFNKNGGGVYATEWTSDAISVWFFPRSSVPSDILGDSPNPSGWGTPVAKFSGSCDFDKSFQDQQIVFDTTFCGDWAGNVWGSGSCASKASTCQSFVQNNPSAFKEAYWSIKSLKVYQNGGGNNPQVQSIGSPSSTVKSSRVPVASSTGPAVPESSAAQSPPEVPAVTDSPVDTLVPSVTPATITVSALEYGQFPSNGEIQTAGIGVKGRSDRKLRNREARHLMVHKQRAARP